MNDQYDHVEPCPTCCEFAGVWRPCFVVHAVSGTGTDDECVVCHGNGGWFLCESCGACWDAPRATVEETEHDF